MNKVSVFFDNIKRNYYNLAKAFVLLIAIVLITWQMPRAAKFKFEFQKSKPWQHETLYAPFNFPIYKDSEALRLEKEEVVKDLIPYFTFKSDKTRSGRAALTNGFVKVFGEKSKDNKDYKIVIDIYDQIENEGIIAHDKILDNRGATDDVYVINNKKVTLRRIGELRDIKSATTAALKLLQAYKLPNETQLAYLLQDNLCINVYYDAELTKETMRQALDMVSETIGMVQTNELIISEGEIITDAKYSVLTSLRQEYAKRSAGGKDNNYVLWGQALLVLLVFLCLYYTLNLVRPDLFSILKNLVMVLLLMLIVILPSFWIIKLNPQFITMMPVALITLILITFFDAKVAVLVQIFSLIIISMVVPNSYEYFFVQLIVCFICVFTMSNRGDRSAYFITSLVIFVTYMLTYLGFSMISDGNLNNFEWWYVAFYALNAIFTMLALPFIILFERIFGYVTDLTLLELSNTNTPLLRRLASEAPGTFQHSMQVANLCEEALYAIGGNTLLARTGAMYHDLGKIANPQYFIENQVGEYNPHLDLSYAESAEIIISHVIDGIELMHKHHLPEQIIDFARTHHGTRRTEYFYQMEVKSNPGVDVNPLDFSYHGPIPFSKETAVLMMADSVEAASRSLKEHNEQNITALVNGIIDKQVADAQLENTNITFRDITKVKKVLIKALMNIYHVRIAYPDQKIK